jgi:oxygen-dependent protoporphyrinogen oxidase
VAHPLDGYGFLTVHGQGLRILGCLFTSSIFPERAPLGSVAITAFVGGARDGALVRAPEAEIWRAVESDLAVALRIEGAPVFRHLERWPRAIPQYEVGHGHYVALGEALERDLPGLFLAGNWNGGPSVTDSLARAATVASRVLAGRHLPAPAPTSGPDLTAVMSAGAAAR